MPEVMFEKFEILDCLKKDVGLCVYAAHHRYLGKKILLKTLDQAAVSDPILLERFQREAKTLARLDHPNIIKVLDFGMFESFFYISFEFFESDNLREALRRGNLSTAQKMAVFRQLACGLDFAHQHHIIHRDIKPENILVNDRGQVKIADFGLAQLAGESSLTQPSSIVGTPGYMSPEQIRGEPLTPQTDLFSLGIVAYELFVGDNPFLGRDVGSTVNNIMSKKVVFSTAPSEVATILPQLLTKNRAERLDSTRTLLTLLPDEPTAEGNPAPVVELPEKRAGRKWPYWAAAGVVLLITVMMIKLSQSPVPENREPLAITRSDTTQIKKEESLPFEEKTESPVLREPVEQRKTGAGTMTAPNELPGKLLVQCTPWAAVWIDGKQADTTPMDDGIALSPGEHELRLLHPKFPAYVQNIRIKPAEEVTITVSLDTLFSFFTCRIYPWGEVYIDNEYQGVTPFAEPLKVSPGRHLLTVVNQQFGSVADSFFVERQDTFQYQLNFEQLKKIEEPLQ